MPPPQLCIRPAVPEDYEALCRLWEILDEHHRRARPDLFRIPQGPRRDRDGALHQMQGADGAILVALVGEEPAGLAVLRVERPPEAPMRIPRDYGELQELVVAPRFRRRGIGAALVKASAGWAEARGLGDLQLSVHEFNRSALSFYESIGFQIRHRRLGLRLGEARAPVGAGGATC